MVDVVNTCPLGHKCEEIKDKAIYRCSWYTEVVGKNPQSEEVINEWRCAMSWMPMMMIENAQTNRGQTQAVESFRNEMVKAQDKVIALATNEQTQARLIKDVNSK